MTRPQVAADPGWPRPRGVAQTLDREIVGMLPMPWIADHTERLGKWFPKRYDMHRRYQMEREDLCQVCGGQRGEEVFALHPRNYVSEYGDARRVPHAGGALCSLRCARLTAAVCPHYRDHGPVDIYRVPKPSNRIDYNPDVDVDEEISIVGLTPIDTLGDS